MGRIQAQDLPEETRQSLLAVSARSGFELQDLRAIPCTLRLENRKDWFPEMKSTLAHPTPKSALKRTDFMGEDRPVDQDFLFDGNDRAGGASLAKRRSDTFMHHLADFMAHEPLGNGLTF